MPALFNLFVALVIIVVVLSLIFWLFKYVTIIPDQAKQIIISIAALLAILYLVAVVIGMAKLPSFF